MTNVDSILKSVGNGELDAYQVLTNPTADQLEASKRLQKLYDSKCEGSPLHPDDDFEKILDAVCDDLQADCK